jgi:hypothetical protein
MSAASACGFGISIGSAGGLDVSARGSRAGLGGRDARNAARSDEERAGRVEADDRDGARRWLVGEVGALLSGCAAIAGGVGAGDSRLSGVAACVPAQLSSTLKSDFKSSGEGWREAGAALGAARVGSGAVLLSAAGRVEGKRLPASNVRPSISSAPLQRVQRRVAWRPRTRSSYSRSGSFMSDSQVGQLT